ncbi:MAG: LysR family transcriptional regulator [Methylobacterium sp.]|nr:LysR family transcriptional regulator [Methylobacterium sp.]MCA3654067.1 LysR family transcriptional regulator [Methylobacterium sp.]MCA3657179.1 LysR family transcriptional regulator [Methylobacterium sp.]MCA3664141.1 LysR family transcriptional regulator [Methylobacterium sp.]MCA3667805.1 LysR family transcriptional regulator [Methylobacterium sp.]
MLQKVSLSAIRIFETVARRGSHKAAAAELNLSPSAISHALKNLEQTMGVQLFEKDGRHVRLTVSGDVFMRHVVAAFDELRRGFDMVSARPSKKVLRLHSAPSIAYAWLTPRLPQFLAAHPGIEVRLSAGTEYPRFNTDDFDADIVYGPIHAPGVIAVPLARETVTPLCSPEMAKRIHGPRDLLDCNLILSDNKQVRWHHWFDANGLNPVLNHDLRFDRSFLALAVAADGLGVALESTLLAEREISGGKLVAPLASASVNITYVGHHLVYPRETRQGGILRMFSDWLVKEIAQPRDEGGWSLTTAAASEGTGA